MYYQVELIQENVRLLYDSCVINKTHIMMFVVLISSRVLNAYLPSNALGSDKLNPLFLKTLSLKLLPYFTHLFNSVFAMSSFPDK